MSKDTKKTEAFAEAIEDVTEVTEGAPIPPSLTIQDLGNLRQILDIAARRGVFKTEEFTIVGETFIKLSNFINAITPPKVEETEAAKEPDTK